MSAVEMTQGDTAPALTATLYSDAALTVPMDLTGATVVLQISTQGGAVLVDDAAVSIVSAAAGTVSYAWQVGDTSTKGVHKGSFKVTFADGTVGHVPNFEAIRFVFQGD
jgi:hypothetical protein